MSYIGVSAAPTPAGVYTKAETNDLVTSRVAKTGDTMTGDLIVDANLLVGTTVDRANLSGCTVTHGQIADDGMALFSADGKQPLDLNRLTSDGGIAVFRKDGATVGSIGNTGGNLYIQGSTSTGKMGLEFGSSALFPRDGDTATDGSNDFGDATYRWRNLYLSGGVYVGGTSSANYLDDYEEGTWTPVVADAATGGNTGSATIAYATYTKIGNQVTVTANLTNIVRTGLTTANVFHVRGLPFTSGTQQTSGTVRTDLVTYQGGRTMAVAAVGVDDSWVTFLACGSNLTDTSIDCGDVTNTTGDIFFTITYFV